MRKAINGISITEEGLLLGLKNETWILPGGKPEDGEDDVACLNRELAEEFPGLRLLATPTYFSQVVGTTPHQGDTLIAKLYVIEVVGSIGPGTEIKDACRTLQPLSFNLSDITRKAILAIQDTGLLP